MGIYYNADGELQEFEEYEHTASCLNCNKKYRQVCEEQVPGFRTKSYDVCPYCGNENGQSLSVDFYNFKISSEEQ